MKHSSPALALAFAISALAAPVNKREDYSTFPLPTALSSDLPSLGDLESLLSELPSLSLPTPTGGPLFPSGIPRIFPPSSSQSPAALPPFPLGTSLSAAGSKKAKRQFPDLSSVGSATGTSFGSLTSDLSALGSLESSGDLGSATESGLAALESLASSSGFGSATESGLAALESLASSSGIGSLKAKRDSVSPTESGLAALESLASSSSFGSATESGLAALESFVSSSGFASATEDGLAALESLASSSGFASPTESGLAALESLAGSSDDLASLFGSGFKEKRQASTVTTSAFDAVSSNDVTDNTGCKNVTLIFARGTLEPGTLGDIVGPELAADLKTDTGSLAVQGVDYPATVEGNAELGAAGGPEMARLANLAVSQCPDSKIVLGGYSQGAMVVHNALSTGDFAGSQVAAVVVFGDPFNAEGFTNVDDSKVVRYCYEGDEICDLSGTTEGTGTHLSYGSRASAAAASVATIVGVVAST